MDVTVQIGELLGEMDEVRSDVEYNNEHRGWMRGRYTSVVSALESVNYKHQVRFAFCEECGSSLDFSESSPNPRIVVHVPTGVGWHDGCHAAEEVEDDPVEAQRLIEAHRVKILERMGRAG